MIIQPDYKQINVLIDNLINFKISNYHKLETLFIMVLIAIKMFLHYLHLLVAEY